jgi:hypothetical protein
MIAIAAIVIAYTGVMAHKNEKAKVAKLGFDGNKLTADNDRTNLLYNPSRLWKDNKLIGNWPWGRPAIPAPSGTKAYFREPTPQLAGLTDWYAEGNQWLRSPEYRDNYVKRYQNAWSGELSQAVLNQLVPGFWHETITKGRVLTQEIKSDGQYNPNGPNLYRYNHP